MYKLDLEQGEEPEIKLPTSVGLEKAREFQKNIFIDYAKAFDCVDHYKLWKMLTAGITRPLYLPPEKLYAGKEATVRTGHGTMNWLEIGK